jgi:hypothetical protein
MRYLLLIYQNEADHAKLSQEELGAEYEAYGEEVQKRGAFLSGEPLMPTNTATTVRVRGGQDTHHGWSFCRDKRAARRVLPAQL